MSKTQKIDSTPETWESGVLGSDERFAKLATDVKEDLVDEALGLQMISIRLQKSLIEDLKTIAKMHGLGYQPLIRQILKRFADCEKKQLLREMAAQMEKEEKENKKREENKKHAAG